jgi:hypothetical protein
MGSGRDGVVSCSYRASILEASQQLCWYLQPYPEERCEGRKKKRRVGRRDVK